MSRVEFYLRLAVTVVVKIIAVGKINALYGERFKERIK